MDKPSLSIVIPLYNASKGIEQLETTLERQGIFSDECPIPVEIILVDDESTDDTAKKASELVARHPIMRLISQKNSGQGAARNTGLASAKMKYGYMMDQDDLLVPGALLHYVNILEENDADLIRFAFDTPAEKDIPKILNQTNNNPFEDETISIMSGREYLDTADCLWAKTGIWDTIFKLEYARKAGARFEPEIRLREDDVFMWRLFISAAKTVICSSVGYHWIQRQASDSHNTDSAHKVSRQITLPYFCKAVDTIIIKNPQSDRDLRINYWLSQKRDWCLFAFWLMIIKFKALSYTQATKEISRQISEGIYPIRTKYPSKHPDLYPSSMSMKTLYRLISNPTMLRIMLRLRLR